MITIRTGNITESTSEYIVNSANDRLILGSGVAQEIKEKWWPNIQWECHEKIQELGGSMPIGTTIITNGWNIGKPIIHAVVKKLWSDRVSARDVVLVTRTIVSQSLSLWIPSIALPAFWSWSWKLPHRLSALSMRLWIELATKYTRGGEQLNIEIILVNNETLKIFEEVFWVNKSLHS